MGNVTTVCSDKTGTLTENKMSVACANIAEEQLNISTQEHGRICIKNNINTIAFNLVAENISINSTAFEGKNAEGQTGLIGSTTECALIDFIAKFGYPYKQQRISSQCVSIYPFDSTLKSMTTLISINDGNCASPNRSKFRVYTKGAPETVIKACTYYMDENGNVQLLSNHIRLKQEALVNKYAKHSLRTLALAYNDIDEGNIFMSLFIDFFLKKALFF
jgi:Ca2+-transporting ATPase